MITGTGDLPVILANKAKAKGMEIISIAFSEESVAALRSSSKKVYHLGIGEANKILKTLKVEGIKEVVLIGKIEKRLIFQTKRFDLRALKLLTKLKQKDDNTLMLAITKEIEKEGIKVLDQNLFLNELFPPKGVLTKRAPDEREWRDIEYGFIMAKEIASLNIGQTIVVKDQAVIAVEAIEGTDETIKRGCNIAKDNGVVVKVSWQNQDRRFDIPTIGIKTIKMMSAGNASVLAIEAGKTMIVNLKEVQAIADEVGISIVAV
ncbi:MAG: UDP-2,3-diacylglucosamine diphosphatase LpxI [Nitrospinae bacterium]|nr:UDP-2,3-diacylglucosamine diphosphatase LpxI [Nitrospinota bacterium]